MRHDAAVLWWQKLGRCQRLAVAAWAILLIAVCFRASILPQQHTVYPIYSNAARNWLASRDLYLPQPGLDDYRYSPSATALLAPLGLLPDGLGSVVWRLLSAAIFLGAFAWWMRAALPPPLPGNQRAVLFLLVIPLLIGNLNNGQSNLLLLGLLLSAAAACCRGYWWMAAACIALATGLKVYPLALGLLLALVFPRRFAVRLLLAVAGVGAASFLFHGFDYVAGQWGEWWHHLLAEDRQVRPMAFWYRDLRLLCAVWIAPLSSEAYLAVQFMAGTGIAAICWRASRQRHRDTSPRTLSPVTLPLACCWMTVFGVATETSTYVLLAPSLAWALVEAWRERRPWPTHVLLMASYGLFTLGNVVAWFPGMSRWYQTLGAYPFAGLLLMAAVAIPELARLSSARPLAVGGHQALG